MDGIKQAIVTFLGIAITVAAIIYFVFNAAWDKAETIEDNTDTVISESVIPVKPPNN